MSSTIDPAKLKVVDLRQELAARGLDTKGNKPVLVKRLKDALEAELQQELPNSSIADTSTEDFDTSQQQLEEQQSLVEEAVESTDVEFTESAASAPSEEDNQQLPVEEAAVNPIAVETTTDTKQVEEKTEPETIENGQLNKKDDISNATTEETSQATDVTANTTTAENPDDANEEKTGEKRKRSKSPSPERAQQRRRSKSPIKEDEPPIDNNKVQLSWYDSDLHLQLDKESFLSAKPLHEGAFGYAWAGVRATHGISIGKVRYEVKVSEELKWDDLSKQYDYHRRDYDHNRRNKKDEKKKNSSQSSTGNSANNKETKSDATEGGGGAENGQAMDTSEAEVKTEIKTETEVTNATENSQDKMEVSESSEKQIKEESKQNENQEATEQAIKGNDEKDDKDNEKNENEKKNEEEKIEKEDDQFMPHLLRVGWSILHTDLQLGQNNHSFAYESSGKFVMNKNYEDFGKLFTVGDVIGAYLDIDDENISVSYTVNGELQAVTRVINKSEFPDDFVLFPHVLSRNFAFELNLGSREEPWFPAPDELADYVFIDKADVVAGPMRPENRSDCEVILMCGLPASGKTHWVREFMETHMDKEYTVIGDKHLLQKMETVNGKPLKSNFKGRWSLLLDKLQKSINRLIDIASQRRRNYIIDETNVIPSAQRRKLRPFEGFKRKAVVVVVDDDEQTKRQNLQEASDGGKHVPDSSVLEMKALMGLPQKGEWLDEVEYVGLDEEKSQEMVKKYNKLGRQAGYGCGNRKFGRRDDRWQNRRYDNRGKNFRDNRSYSNNRYDRGPPQRQSNWHAASSGGAGWRDRRDHRGPPAGASRDWRNSRGSIRNEPRPSNRSSSSNNYNRNRSSGGGGGNRSGNWTSWNSGSQGVWGSSSYGGGGGWSSGASSGQNWGQSNQWKYGGGGGSGSSAGQGYGGYAGGWGYYNQYPQGWSGSASNSSQGKPTNKMSMSGSTGKSTGSGSNNLSQQQWAQYAQQYAQQCAAFSQSSSAYKMDPYCSN